MTTSKSSISQESQYEYHEIDLSQVAAALGRNRLLICGIMALSVSISVIYAFTRNPVWKGEFQIVLESQNSFGGSTAPSANSIIANLAGIGLNAGPSSIQTEVKILESPSVLLPVFDFVKSRKDDSGIDTSSWKFNAWVNSTSIDLVKGTSVLNIAYTDTDKSLVTPVLEKISTTYQEYSGRDRQRDIAQGIYYLEQQLVKFQNQYDQSMRTAQAYALNNGLGIQDGMPTEEASRGSSVEASREVSQNKVNSLRQQIADAQAVGDARLYQAPQLAANSANYRELQEVETKLNQQSVLLTPLDQSIKRLQRQRKTLIAYINQQTIVLLRGELMTEEAKLASLTRPREIILKHRELIRTALRDEKTLSAIENQLQTLKLNKARQTNPWELISSPTLLDKPVSPRKTRIIAFGAIIGLLLGIGTALIRERKSGIIYSEHELINFIPCPLLNRLSAANPKYFNDTAQLLADGPLVNAESIGLLVVGDIPQQQIEPFSVALRTALGGRPLVVSRDLLKTRKASTQLLITASGVIQRSFLQQLCEKLALQGTPLAGWLLIDPTLTSQTIEA